MADFTQRRARKLLTPADLPKLIYPGSVSPELRAAAETKAFTAIARVRDHRHVALLCHSCGGINTVRINVLKSYNPLCHHCLERKRRATASTGGLRFLHRDPAEHKYAFYHMECGHTVRRQLGRIERIAGGRGSARCETCLVIREEQEAMRYGWKRLGRDSKDKPNYRLYRHDCGYEQRIAVANMRWGQCDCAGCGQSWTAKPSYIYLLDIRHPATKRHYLKLGYSARPAKRHKHQLGLPKDAHVEVLRMIAMPTGHDACAMEKAAHARLKREYPEAVVPDPEFHDLMNVVSEIYRPDALSILQETLDRIEAGVAANAPVNPSDNPTGSDPDAAQPDPEALISSRSAIRNPAAHRGVPE